MRDPCLDLFLGSSCVVCERPGRVLCEVCRSQLPLGAQVCWPTPCPPGLALPMAAGDYDGALKVMVNAHKERAAFSLVAPLGAMLALAVEALGDRTPDRADTPWLLVPVPSRGRVVRARGHDPMLRVTRRAAVVLRRRGRAAGVATLLRTVTAARDQAGLDASERAANLRGSMRAVPGRTGRLRACRPARIVVTDDVLTTGSTAREAQRALEEAGLTVDGIATVAATRRRDRVLPGATDSEPSLPFSHGDD